MDGIWRVFGGFAGTVGLWALSGVVLLLAAVVALYVSALFPLTGQWRSRFAQWRRRK